MPWPMKRYIPWPEDKMVSAVGSVARGPGYRVGYYGCMALDMLGLAKGKARKHPEARRQLEQATDQIIAAIYLAEPDFLTPREQERLRKRLRVWIFVRKVLNKARNLVTLSR